MGIERRLNVTARSIDEAERARLKGQEATEKRDRAILAELSKQTAVLGDIRDALVRLTDASRRSPRDVSARLGPRLLCVPAGTARSAEALPRDCP